MDEMEEFDNTIESCKSLMSPDFFSLWNMMRLSTVTDKIIFKITQVRKLEMKGTVSLFDLKEMEQHLKIIHNCSVVALMKLKMISADEPSESEEIEEQQPEISTFYVDEGDIPEITEAG